MMSENTKFFIPSKKIYPKIKNDSGMACHTPCGPLKKAKKQVTMPLLSLSTIPFLVVSSCLMCRMCSLG